MSEINDTEELTQGNFPIDLKPIDQYQQQDPILKAKYRTGTYHRIFICGGSNINIYLIGR